MLVFDQLRRGDRPLQWVAGGVLFGMLALLTGLWYVQVVSARKYEADLKVQSFRTVRMPAVRGKIMDRSGALLADNQPRFTVNLYLEDLRELFKHKYTNEVRAEYRRLYPGKKFKASEIVAMQQDARYRVVSNLVSRVSGILLPQPLILNSNTFFRHYSDQLALPMPVFKDLDQRQVAIFMERMPDTPGVELEVQALRHYPNGFHASHILGFLQREDDPVADEEVHYRYRLPDYRGKSGIESAFDESLRGRAGAKSIRVNNIGYRIDEEMWARPDPGRDVQLTIDLAVQKAAETALRSSGPDTRGAAVVLDVQNGDVLALASSPTFDPNQFLQPISHEENARLNDKKLTPYLNRAVHGTYSPGSIFKIVVGLAAMEAGVLDPTTLLRTESHYRLGRRLIRDTAPPDDYDFKHAFEKSSNYYFIEYGRRAGVQRIVEMGLRFRLGEKTGVVAGSGEQRGYFPEVGQKYKLDGAAWQEGDTANLCIGQGEITVTPVQMAVMTAAVANGGKVFKPRLIMGSPARGEVTDNDAAWQPEGVMAGDLKISPRSLEVVRDAMLADVEDPGGSGHPALIPGYKICGKTGTAQVKIAGGGMDHVTWFVSFAPYEAPQYAVVVMIESGSSGGGTCAPKAKMIYEELRKRGRAPEPPRLAVSDH